uniref:Bifunctional inhibitor/plant lipid transfer protein/seed storage helical domain-containing protein n=1 Tax=Ananas comosus var. bracteatus TaxID=296719 RepID=A0A6V7NMR0_ANACO|nr:unnamed protein product [Ananas comosus var. bracteatus]
MVPSVLMITVALATVALLLANCASAQSSCAAVIAGLAPCLDFLTGNTSTPSSSCCSMLAGSVRSQPPTSSPGMTICETRALKLPGACEVQTPLLVTSHCKIFHNRRRDQPDTVGTSNTVDPDQLCTGDPIHTVGPEEHHTAVDIINPDRYIRR